MISYIYFYIEFVLIGNIEKRSSIYATEPWGFKAKISFINIALLVKSGLNAGKVLTQIHRIEKELGRKNRHGQYTSRNIDVDIIFYNDDIIEEKNLIVPHPRMHIRRFVLEPLQEICPEYMHPKLKKTVLSLLENCKDDSRVSLLEN